MDSTRRRFLLSCAASTAARAEVRPSERVRYLDPGTEFEVFRLTDPKHASILPPATARIFPRRGGWLLYANDVSGSLQPHALDLKKWESRSLADGASSLISSSLTLTPDDRYILWAEQGGAVQLAPVSGGAPKAVYRLNEAPASTLTLGVTADGPSVFVPEKNVLWMVPLVAGRLRKLVENADDIVSPIARPRRASVLYRSADAYWITPFDGSRPIRLKTPAEGSLGPAIWSPDGRLVFYLHYPPGGRAHAMRENNPDTGEDNLIATTSQFVAFSANRDATVFVGASRNLAGPFVLLLIRSVRREFALCEHKASDPTLVAPVFSPDSQKIFFQSDRHGKPALYSMTIDKLVEKTEEQEAEIERERNKATSSR
ncbi:MAG: hypothetical protein FJW31_08315 [Acidobacteria bacterium]|nr:hypothetical protein [Acidobacteriota bacterium]